MQFQSNLNCGGKTFCVLVPSMLRYVYTLHASIITPIMDSCLRSSDMSMSKMSIKCWSLLHKWFGIQSVKCMVTIICCNIWSSVCVEYCSFNFTFRYEAMWSPSVNIRCTLLVFLSLHIAQDLTIITIRNWIDTFITSAQLERTMTASM